MKTNRLTMTVALLLALLLTLASCGGEAEEANVLPDAAQSLETQTTEPVGESDAAEETPGYQGFTIGYYVNKSLNPYTCHNTVNRAIIGLLYEPLYAITPGFDAESCLALSCVKGGEGEWTLTIREGVHFWNGEELTAYDVVYSLAQAKGADSIYSEQLAPMEELKAGDNNTVTFQWNEERGDLALLLEIPIVQKGTAWHELPMGTGPYLPSLEEGSISLLTANGSWWQEKTLPTDTIHLYAAQTSDLLIYGFERGDVTLVASDLTDPDSLGYSGQYEPWDYPTSHLIYLGCNTGTGPCREQTFRQALQSALDRETIVQRLLSGHAIASPLTFLPDTSCYDSELAAAYTQPDPSVLTEWSGEKLTLVVNADSSFKTTIARFIAASFNEMGMSVQVNELSWTAYQQALREGDYDLYLGEVKLGPDLDPSALVGEQGSLNFSGFHSEAVERALEGYRLAGSEERPAAAGSLSRALAQECPILPVCFEEHSVLTGWGTVEKLTSTQSDLFYGFEDWMLGE